MSGKEQLANQLNEILGSFTTIVQKIEDFKDNIINAKQELKDEYDMTLESAKTAEQNFNHFTASFVEASHSQ